MRLFVYVQTSETGFVPNPYWDYCTLACCKPDIRRVAQDGDFVMSLSPKRLSNRVGIQALLLFF